MRDGRLGGDRIEDDAEHERVVEDREHVAGQITAGAPVHGAQCPLHAPGGEIEVGPPEGHRSGHGQGHRHEQDALDREAAAVAPMATIDSPRAMMMKRP